MSVQINILADGNTKCGKIIVTDISQYTSSPDSRADYGIAIMVAAAGTLDPTLSDFTNIDPWTISVTNGILYTVFAYQIPVWVAGTYNSMDVAFYGGYFWYNSSGGATSGEPGISSDWTVVSNDVVGQTIFRNFCTRTTQTSAQITPNCVINHIACYIYSICNTASYTQYFSITELDGTLVDIIVDSNATAIYDPNGNIIGYSLPAYTCTQITLPSEGVYILSMGDDITCMPEQYVIFELCKYYDCYFDLVKKILCDDFDPCCDNKHHHKHKHHNQHHHGECCEDCDEERLRQHEIFRLTLNKMSALINTLQIKTFYDAVHYGNIINIPANRMTELEEIEEIIEELNDIIVRCGLCGGAQSDEVKKPCTTC